MDRCRVRSLFLALIGASLSIPGSFCAAEEEARQELRQKEYLPSVFNKDSVKDIFEGDLRIMPQKEIVLQLPEQKKLKELRESEKRQKAAKPSKDSFAASSSFNATAAGPKASGEKQPSTREQIFQQYGPPGKPHPVKAQDSAPGPFKAMLECLHINDQECAYQYAVQYVRYQRDLESTLQQATAIEGIAMRQEDMLPPGSWPDAPEYQQYDWLKDIKVEEYKDKDNRDELDVNRIDDDTRALLRKAKERQNDLFNNNRPGAAISDQLNEKEERQKARNFLQRRVPRAADGKVDIFFFLRPYDEDAISMAGDIEKLYQRTKQEKNVNFVAFTIDDTDQSAVRLFRNKTSATFPVQSGLTLTKKLGIGVSPTVLFVSATNGRQHIEEGLRNFYYYDELLNLMQGR